MKNEMSINHSPNGSGFLTMNERFGHPHPKKKLVYVVSKAHKVIEAHTLSFFYVIKFAHSPCKHPPRSPSSF